MKREREGVKIICVMEREKDRDIQTRREVKILRAGERRGEGFERQNDKMRWIEK